MAEAERRHAEIAAEQEKQKAEDDRQEKARQDQIAANLARLKVGSEWSGICHQDRTQYPMRLIVTKREGRSVVGRVQWPTLGDTETIFEGTLTDDTLRFTEVQFTRNHGTALGGLYETQIKDDTIQGVWSCDRPRYVNQPFTLTLVAK